MREHQVFGGRLTITLLQPATGRIVLERRVNNLVTLDGRTLLAEMLTGATDMVEMKLAVGGPPNPVPADYQTRPPALEDTGLQNKLLAVPVIAGAPARQFESPGEVRVFTELSGTLQADLGGDKLVITEAGIQITKLDNTEILYNRVVFAPISKEPDMQMTLTWEVIF